MLKEIAFISSGLTILRPKEHSTSRRLAKTSKEFLTMRSRPASMSLRDRDRTATQRRTRVVSRSGCQTEVADS